MRYQVQKVNDLEYKVWKKGKCIKTFYGANAYDDAHEYVQDCVEDDRLYAHFYAE